MRLPNIITWVCYLTVKDAILASLCVCILFHVLQEILGRTSTQCFYTCRIEAEEERKRDVGALAYYKEWVKAYKKDTSKEAVQKHFEETGEEEGIQLLDMFSYQTDKEYRIMMGTDVRIRRDPLTMRMRPDQIKQGAL